MPVTTICICGLITAVQLVYVFYSFNPHYLKVALGYKAYVDLFFSLGMTVYFAMSGTISGILLSTISGAILSLGLYACRRAYGYRRLETINGEKKWVEYPSDWTIASTKQWLLSMKEKAVNYLPA